MAMLEVLKRIIRQQTVTINGQVTNLYGATPSFGADEVTSSGSVWQKTSVPVQALLGLQDFYAMWLNTAERRVSEQGALADGSCVLNVGDTRLLLARSQVRSSGALVLPLTVVTSGTNEPFAVYVDGTMIRQGSGQLSLALPLPAGDHTIEILAVTQELGVITPTTIKLSPEFEQLPTPLWSDISTGYLDAATGTTTVKLSWFTSPRVGSWNVLRRQTTDVSAISEVGQSFGDGFYTIVVAGDQTLNIPTYAQCYAGLAFVGTAVSAVLDDTTGKTNITLLLPLGTTVSNDWVGTTLRVGAWNVLATVANTSSAQVMSYDDTGVQLEASYEYALQGFGLFNTDAKSQLSAVRRVTAGDQTPPASITFKSGYPVSINKRIIARYTTPTDADYAGLRVYYRQGITGTSANTKAAGSSILDAFGVSWTNNQWSGYRMITVSGTGAGQDRGIQSNDGSTLVFDSPLLDGIDNTTHFRIYKLTLVTTDTGKPSIDDETTFTPLGDGDYCFCSVDRAGNEQLHIDAAVYAYVASNDTFIGPNQPPVITIRQVSATEQAGFSGYTDTTRWAILELNASDPIDATTNVKLYYQQKGAGSSTSMPASTVAVANTVDNPAGTRSRYIAIDRSIDQAWVRVWATDNNEAGAYLQSDVMTYSVDFNDTPELVSLESRVDTLMNTVTISGTVDDDSRGLKWWVEPDSTNNPTASAPTHVGDLLSNKTFTLNVALNDGEKRTVKIQPYAGWNSGSSQVAGAAGVVVAREFTRSPRSFVSLEDRQENGQTSATRVKATFTLSPQAAVVLTGTVTGATATSIVDSSKTFSTTAEATNNYISSNQRWFFARMESGTAKGCVRKIIGHPTAATLAIEGQWTTLSGAVVTPANGDTYSIVNGAVLVRLDGSGLYLPASYPALYFNRTEGQLDGRQVDFYGAVNGCPVEPEHRLFVDGDNKAVIGSLQLTAPSTNILKVKIDQWDDDVKTWRAYEKKGNWPTKKSDGTQGGQYDTPDSDYLRWDGDLSQVEYSHSASSGVWYVIVIPSNSFTEDGDPVYGQINMASPPAAVGDITLNAPTAQASNTNRLTWSHNTAAVATTPHYSVKVYAYRQDLGQGTETELTAGSTRLVNTDADGTDTVGSQGGFDHVGSFTRSTQGAGGILQTWAYTVKLYNDLGALVSTYTTTFSDYYAPAVPSVSAASITTTDSGECDTVDGTCLSAFTRQVNWTVASSNDSAYRLDVYRATDSAGSSFSLFASGLSTTATSITDSDDCLYTAAGTANRWYKYRIDVVRKSDGVSVNSTTTTQLARYVLRCSVSGSSGSGGLKKVV